MAAYPPPSGGYGLPPPGWGVPPPGGPSIGMIYRDKAAEQCVFSGLDVKDTPFDWGWWNPVLAPFDVQRDTAAFMDALARKDDRQLMDILTGRRPEEIQAIRGAFQAAERDMIREIEAATMDGVERVFVALARDPCEFDAVQLRDAIKGLGTTDNVLIEVLSTRSRAELQRVEQWYGQLFGVSLRDDIRGDTSGNYEQLCLALLDSNRDQVPFYPAQAAADAQSLKRAGEGRLGTDDDRFIAVFANNPRSQLMAIAAEYSKISGLERKAGDDITSLLDRAVEGETSGSYRDMLRALLNPEKFFAHVLHDAVKGTPTVHGNKLNPGFGTNDAKLVRLLRRAGSTPARLFAAKQMYERIHKKSMVKDIEDDTHGVYKFTLRRLACTHQGAYIAVLLREAIHRFDMDELGVASVLINVVQDDRQLQEAVTAYRMDYGEELDKDVSCIFTPDLTRILKVLAKPRAQVDAENMHFATDRVGTKESVLIDILVTRSNREIIDMKEQFAKLTGKSLNDVIAKETSGNFEDVLLRLLNGARREGMNMDPGQAAQIADEVYKAGEGRLGTNDDKFIEIFAQYSWQELTMVNEAYKAKRGHDLERAIKKETSGDYRDTLLALVNPNKYIAELLHGAMAGLGTDDQRLVRLVAKRPKYQWGPIKHEYEAQFGKRLEDAIAGDTSGKYKTVLLMCVS